MKNIKKLPIPIAALMLSMFALGNLVQSYGDIFRNIFGVIGGIIFIGLVIKFISSPKEVKEELNNPVVASVLPTFSMGMMLLATYLKPIQGSLAGIIWYIGLLLHIIFIISFSLKYLKDFNIKTVFPSWFIVYVGIAVSAVTAPAFGKQNIGKIGFYFAFISYFILLVIVIKRLVNHKEMPEPARPTFAILAAPASLCLAGYMNSFEVKNMVIVCLLLALSQITYFIVLANLPRLLKSKFYPSFAGFTFPLVITGLSLKLTNKFLVEAGSGHVALKYLVKFEELVAVIIVVYVLIKFIKFLFKNK